MKVYKQLVRTFTNSGEMEMPKSGKQKLFYAIMGIIAVCFIMVPCCLLVGYLSYGITLALGDGCADGTLFIIHFIALFSIVFGMNVILNVFYFAGDIPYILPLPISPCKVVAAKFTTAYLSESVMQILILVSALVGYYFATGIRWWMLPFALLGTLTLPVAPLAYCGILCVLVMSFTKLIRKKSHARKLSIVIFLFLLIAALYFVSLLRDIDMMQFTEQLKAGKSSFFYAMNIVFPTNYFFGQMLTRQSLMAFLWYVLVNAGIIGVFLLLAQKLYYRGVIGLGAEGGDKKPRTVAVNMVKAVKVNKPWVAYWKKEFKVLFRTPAFFLNCIAVNGLWPILVYTIYVMQPDSAIFQWFYVSYRIGNEMAQWVVTLLVLGVTVLLTAANSIASSSITREGKQYGFMKYIPLPYKTQFHIKALVSILISAVFVEMYVVILCIALKVSMLVVLFYIVVSFLEVVFISYLGLYLDTVNPKLVWDDELNALRGNYNIFFNMAYAMLIAVIFALVLAALYFFTKMPLWILDIIIVVLLLIANRWMIAVCLKKGIKNLEEL